MDEALKNFDALMQALLSDPEASPDDTAKLYLIGVVVRPLYAAILQMGDAALLYNSKQYHKALE